MSLSEIFTCILFTLKDGDSASSLSPLVLMLDNIFGEENFPDIQSKLPLAQLEAISFCPVTCYFEEDTISHLPDKVSPESLFL